MIKGGVRGHEDEPSSDHPSTTSEAGGVGVDQFIRGNSDISTEGLERKTAGEGRGIHSRKKEDGT